MGKSLFAGVGQVESPGSWPESLGQYDTEKADLSNFATTQTWWLFQYLKSSRRTCRLFGSVRGDTRYPTPGLTT